ncbi:MAG: Uma2 family endonuclease [Flammeovirgaceae bacterium]|nr:Uma2 family endonuclease [Flammeovirgaceae bacterium]
MTSEQLISPPRTIMEVYKMLPEGTLAEVINGTLYMSPAPSTEHQRIILKIITQMSAFVEQHRSGEVFVAPYDVYLDEHSNVVQPDIVYIPTNKKDLILKNGFHGVPDLIVEILSPGNSSHDSGTKKELYEKFGVKEYWIVDPDTKQATGYSLLNKNYEGIGTFNSKIVSHLLNVTIQF